VQDAGGRHLLQQDRSGDAIGDLSAGEQEGDGPAVAIGQRVDLGRAAAARAAERLALLPPLWNGPPLSSRVIGSQQEGGMKDIQILGVDLGKNSCSVVGLDRAGRVLLRRRTRREGVIALAAKLPGCVVAMEACCGAHHLGV
jgi:hypothetical protein